METNARDRLWPLLLGILLLLLLPALGVPAGADEGGEAAPLPRVPPRFVGIDDVDPFDEGASDPARLALLGGAGDLLVRTTPIPWGRIEPQAPLMEGRQLHDWEALDRFVAAWSAAGFEVVLVLDPACAWASTPAGESAWLTRVRKGLPADVAGALTLEATGATVPGEEFWAEWERFVREVAERYDGDEVDDAPDLARPVQWIQIVGRPASPRDWLGSAAEYSRLLHLASQGVAKASGAVRVVHGAVDFHALGRAPIPSDAELLRRTGPEDPNPLTVAGQFEIRYALSFALLTLSMRRLYGAATHVGSWHLADEAADLTYVRHLLDAQVRSDLEVWLVDSPPAKLLASEIPTAAAISPEELRIRTSGRRLEAWRLRGQAFDVVRTVANARASGATRVFLGGGTRDRDDGLTLLADDRVRRPAYFALRQLTGLLGGHEVATKERVGRNATAYHFAFPKDAPRPGVFVVARDADPSWAGDPTDGEQTTNVALRIPDGTYVVEQMALADGEPARRQVQVTSGTITLPITSAPVYIYPDV